MGFVIGIEKEAQLNCNLASCLESHAWEEMCYKYLHGSCVGWFMLPKLLNLKIIIVDLISRWIRKHGLKIQFGVEVDEIHTIFVWLQQTTLLFIVTKSFQKHFLSRTNHNSNKDCKHLIFNGYELKLHTMVEIDRNYYLRNINPFHVQCIL